MIITMMRDPVLWDPMLRDPYWYLTYNWPEPDPDDEPDPLALHYSMEPDDGLDLLEMKEA